MAKRFPRPSVMALAALVLAGCSSGSSGDPAAGTRSGATSDASLSVVASTNVYADIARAVAGNLATVTSIITSSTQDPHEYEATAQDRLALDRADLVIKNGGGYDPFITRLHEGGSGHATVLDAVEISGLAPDDDHSTEPSSGPSSETASETATEPATEPATEDEGHEHVEGFNEHVWYDFHEVEKVAEEISHELSKLDPANATTYAANHAAFAAQIESLETTAEGLRATAAGKAAAVTEPVPLYLLAELGLVDRTPGEFSEAVEEGADVPPRVLQETLDLFADEDIAVLAYNTQTADATTERVRAAAEAAGVPVVDFSETLPEGTSYLEWQQANLANLAAALGGR